MARFRIGPRLRRPSLKTALGVTRAKRRFRRATGYYALTRPLRAPRNAKRRLLRRAGYYSTPMKWFRFLSGRSALSVPTVLAMSRPPSARTSRTAAFRQRVARSAPGESASSAAGRAPRAFHTYTPWELALVVGATVLGIGFSSTDVGAVVLLGAIVYVCIADWTGLSTLRGLITWANQSRGTRNWLIVLLILVFPITLVIYDWRICFGWFDDRRHAQAEEPLMRQRTIAELEAQLGMLPATEGDCRSCGKPLQVGAQFCQFCRTPVVEQPRICPACATTTLPDAQWCPHCGATLG